MLRSSFCAPKGINKFLDKSIKSWYTRGCLEQEFRRRFADVDLWCLLSGRGPSPMLDEDEANMLPAMNRTKSHNGSWQKRNTSVIVTRPWRLAVALPERNYRRRCERLFCGMWPPTFRPHPRGKWVLEIRQLMTSFSDERIFYSYEYLNNFPNSCSFILSDFSVYLNKEISTIRLPLG